MASKKANSTPAPNEQPEQVQVREWVGPLPSPRDLSDFDAAVTSGAERIVQQWETETEHRRRIESRELTVYAVNAIIGRVFALIFVLAALGTSAYMASIGAQWPAAVVGGGRLAGVAWAFNRTRR